MNPDAEGTSKPVSYKPHKKQVEAHMAVPKRSALLWGRQVGKTYWSVNHTWINAVRKQGRYIIVFKTYRQAHEVVWKQYLQTIPEALRKKTNENELYIELPYIKGNIKLPDGTEEYIEHDVNQPPSSIQFLGSDQADSHRGMKVSGMIFDEYGDQEPDNWSTVYEPMLSTTDGWAIFMGTPKGYNHWYDLVQYAQDNPDDWFYSEATWRDNPAVGRSFIVQVRKEAEARGTLNSFLQEYELQFRSVEGAVYPEFKRQIHVLPANDPLPEQLTIYAGIDFGWDNPTACLFVGIDFDDNWYIFDEIYARATTINDLVPIIQGKLAGKRMTLMVGDSAQAEHIGNLQQQGFPIVPVKKRNDSITLGIGLISNKLKPRIQLAGQPKPKLFITNNCKNFILELEQYKYPEAKKERNPGEIPVKKNDHGPDALRYLALHLKYGIVEQDKPIKSGLQFNEFGLPR